MKEVKETADVLNTRREPRAGDTPGAKSRRKRVSKSEELCIDPNTAKWLR